MTGKLTPAGPGVGGAGPAMQGNQVATGGAAAAARSDLAPVLKQLNLASLRTRTEDLMKTIKRLIQTFQGNPGPDKWSEVLPQFSLVNVDLLNLMEEMEPVVERYVVFPKNVDAEKAAILPIMLSSKLLPEMEAEQRVIREEMEQGLGDLPPQAQIEILKKRIQMINANIDTAERVFQEERKALGLGSARQAPHAPPATDKARQARLMQEGRALLKAIHTGEGLRLPLDQRQLPAVLPPHLRAAYPEHGESGAGKNTTSPTPPSRVSRTRLGGPQLTDSDETVPARPLKIQRRS